MFEGTEEADNSLISMYIHTHLLKFAILTIVGFLVQSCAISFHRMAVLPDKLHEVSGMYIHEPNHIWLHNDSGNLPLIYQTNRNGVIVDSIVLGIQQMVDWEDMTADDVGNIYIADIGNNALQRKYFTIYKYSPATEATQTIHFSYPNSSKKPTYNSEGILWYQDSLYLFTKNTYPPYNYATHIFTIPDQPGRYTAMPKGKIPLKNRMVTGASLSPDGKTLALTAYRLKKILWVPLIQASLFLITLDDWKPVDVSNYKIPPWGISRPYEAVDFVDHSTIYLGSEKSPIHRPMLHVVRIKADKQEVLYQK